ncbi:MULTISPECIES: hybrid sensor histidine kinase/response regulator [Fischerella]|uniref:hybrid sensor histidine kinase/response regulator n=1 Tax=Fischerella TaxID=1190 RepID=UPI0002FD2974|nr:MULTISPECIES: hybrid sensor histidine kinase/response regulator [Fischerella]MBD2430068.1 hybrid sensor histidine kinase/response regulator [Fischerella sp. FACHB-380]
MITDSAIREQGYIYFLAEAPELLHQVEQELFSLSTDFSNAKVHNLMRATHTIKGGAANVGLEVISKVAHYLEDVVKSLYHPDVVIDAQLQTLLVEAYECLRLPITAELTGTTIDEQEILQRSATVFAKLQEKLGDAFTDSNHIPTSAELGFDIIQSIFETGVQQRLETIATALQSTTDAEAIAELLRSEAEVFLGLGESLNLPGLCNIAEAIIKALATHPQEVFKIAAVALADLQQAQSDVLAGDRSQGGTPSQALQQLTTKIQPSSEIDLNAEIEELYEFLTQHFQVKGKCLKPQIAKLYLQVVYYLLAWFEQELKIPTSELNLSLLVPQFANLHTHDNFPDWLQQFWQFISEKEDSYSLSLYRQGVILTVILAVSRLQAQKGKIQNVVLENLGEKIKAVAQEYKQYPPVNHQEKQWFASQKLQNFIKNSQIILPGINNKIIEENCQLQELAIEQDSYQSNKIQKLNLENFSIQISEIPKNLHSHSLVTPESQIILNNDVKPNVPPISRQKTFVRVDVEDLQRLDYLVGELLICEQRYNLQNEKLKDAIKLLLQQLHQHQDGLEDTLQLQKTTDSLNAVLQQSQQMQHKQQSLVLNVIDQLVSARMLPLGYVVERFPHMLQHLSQVYGKQVQLQLIGTQVLVDKAIAEKLYDPLLQLLRNAFDHGIELPEVRRQQGKPEQGVIEISAYHRGSQTVIEVRDDGQGLNFHKIYTKAVQLGLLSADNTSIASNQLLEFLFQPGFSTTDQVSEISGRGVGLDIVRSQLQALNGSVTVQSLPGQGTTFILTIPFSMTTEKLMLVQAEGVTYALLLDSIEKILIPTPEQIKVFNGKQVLYLQTEHNECIVTLQQMAKLMPYSDCDRESLVNSLNSPVLLLRCQQEILALVVDQIIGEQELVIRPLGSAIAPPNYVYGCTSLADGTLVLVIDGALLTQTQQQRIQPHLEYMRLPVADILQQNSWFQLSTDTPQSLPLLNSASASKVILIVDDNLSFRQTLSMTLQKFGYQVLQAENGLEALEKLQQHPEIQLVISDLEMPHMNGLEFLSRLQQHPQVGRRPVIILTSRSVQIYGQMAQHLGAIAYLTKPYVEQELVSTVERFVSAGELTPC